jgi:hypothetical protein
MPLPEDQRHAIDELVIRARHLYRTALKIQTEGEMPDEKMADMYVDGQVIATFTSMLWRQSGERARERMATAPTRQPAAELPPGEDDPTPRV